MYPVIPFRAVQNLLAKNRIHATSVHRVVFGRKIVERFENCQLISAVIGQRLSHERYDPRMPSRASRETEVSVHAGTPKNGTKTELSMPWSMSPASITGLPARNSPTIFLALVERPIISAPNLPRCRLARSHKRAFDMRVYKKGSRQASRV
jgi:hypothetical protein